MPTLTLQQKNDQVLRLEEKVEVKLGKAWQVIKKAVAKIDPDGLLIFSQAHEIERLQVRCAVLGTVLGNVEGARERVLREFARLKGLGVDVDQEAVEAVRTCLVERAVEDKDDHA